MIAILSLLFTLSLGTLVFYSNSVAFLVSLGIPIVIIHFYKREYRYTKEDIVMRFFMLMVFLWLIFAIVISGIKCFLYKPNWSENTKTYSVKLIKHEKLLIDNSFILNDKILYWKCKSMQCKDITEITKTDKGRRDLNPFLFREPKKEYIIKEEK